MMMIAIPKDKKKRKSESQFSDPSRDHGGAAQDSMEASLQEMERARASQPAMSETEQDKSSKQRKVGQGGPANTGQGERVPTRSQGRK
jgi:hypothetical protein